MRRLFLLALCITSTCFCNDAWLKEVENRIDEDAVAWLREQIKQELPEQPEVNLDHLINDQCKNCFSGHQLEGTPQILIFMSFSVPEEAWLQLSHEMEGEDAAFVVRGLPQNSFRGFAKKVMRLKEKGMNAEIQLNPTLFKQYGVTQVPTFVLLDDKETFEKVSGNISLKCAKLIGDNA